MAPGTVIITGARGGMTALTAKSYHQRHPEDHLILLVRDPAKVLPAELPAPSDKVHHAAFEMSDLSAVRSAAKNIVEMVTSGKVPPIEALVCSAAIQVVGPDQPRLTKDGYEETCAVNHLAHFALILDLLPVMKSDGRIVIVGSDSHKPDYKYFKLKAKYDKLEKLLKVQPGSEPVAEAQDRGMQRYGTSKLLQIMTANELARRLSTHPKYSNIRVSIFNPGSMGGTSLFRDWPTISRTMVNYAFRFPSIMNYLDPGLNVSLKETSAATLLKITEDPTWSQSSKTGEAPYYSPNGDLGASEGEANEVEKCKELWEDSARLLGYTDEQALL